MRWQFQATSLAPPRPVLHWSYWSQVYPLPCHVARRCTSTTCRRRVHWQSHRFWSPKSLDRSAGRTCFGRADRCAKMAASGWPFGIAHRFPICCIQRAGHQALVLLHGAYSSIHGIYRLNVVLRSSRKDCGHQWLVEGSFSRLVKVSYCPAAWSQLAVSCTSFCCSKKSDVWM